MLTTPTASPEEPVGLAGAGSEVDDLLRIARVSYSEGEMSLLELLDAAEAFRESQIMGSQLTSEHWIRYYDLERAMGGVPVAATTGGNER